MDCRLLFEALGGDVNLPFDPPACMWALSKDLKGTLHTEVGREPVEGGLSPWPLTRIDWCRKFECGVAIRDMSMKLDVSSYECDSEIGRMFDGGIGGRVVAAHGLYGDADRLSRDVHCGGFEWETEAAQGRGGLHGVSEACTHAAREECLVPHHWEGTLFGKFEDVARFEGGTALVVASYVLDMVSADEEPSEEEGRRLIRVKGALEGVVIQPC